MSPCIRYKYEEDTNFAFIMDYPILDEKIKVPRFEESAGFYTTPERSKLMSKIKATNSRPEVALRKALWACGLRYRIHVKTVSGKPDIAFVRWKVAVFVDGDFWHGYNWSEKKEKLGRNKAFWQAKIERNMQRDTEVNALLEGNGWVVLRIWEHEIKHDLGASVYRVLSLVCERAGADIGEVWA